MLIGRSTTCRQVMECGVKQDRGACAVATAHLTQDWLVSTVEGDAHHRCASGRMHPLTTGTPCRAAFSCHPSVCKLHAALWL